MKASVTVLLTVLGVLVAAHVRMTMVLAGRPVSFPVLWYAAATVLLPLGVLMLAGRGAMDRNRWPRIYWRTVTT
jgi:hypothetical protein